MFTYCVHGSQHPVFTGNAVPVYSRRMSQRPIDVALAWARERGWNNSAFARELGVERQNVSNWQKRGLPPEWHERVASVFGKSVDALLGRDAVKLFLVAPETNNNVEPLQERKKVPVISWVQAGALNGVVDNYEPGQADEWVDALYSKPGPRAFALRVQGESMLNPLGSPSFPEGSIVIVDPDRAPVVGDYVIAKDVATQKATFKRLASDGARWFLRPLNPAFPTIEIDSPELRVIGVVAEYFVGAKL